MWQTPAPWPHPAAGQLGGAETPEQQRGVFGRDPDARPGRVPWGWRQVALALLIAAAPILALTLTAALLPARTTGAKEPAMSIGLALVTVVGTVLIDGWFVFWAWFYSLRRRRLPLASWGFRRVGVRILWFVPVLFGVYTFLIGYTLAYEHIIGPMPQQDITRIFPHTLAGGVLFGLTAIVIAPLLEETLFRGFVFQGLARSWGLWAGAAVSGLLFALSHQDVSVIVPFTVLGMALALLFYYTRSLWTNIALHASFNLIAFLLWVFTK